MSTLRIVNPKEGLDRQHDLPLTPRQARRPYVTSGIAPDDRLPWVNRDEAAAELLLQVCVEMPALKPPLTA